LAPTTVERDQAQLLLISTAHRLATSLMLGRRKAALEQLESGDGDLLVEWSAPHHAELGDREAWRLASPHWTPRRERLVERQLQLLRDGEIDDPDEPDPEQSFKSQWLNQWPLRKTELPSGLEPLLPAGVWRGLAAAGLESDGPVWVALEDAFGYGQGAAVAVCCPLPDGRYEVDGWFRDDWDTAVQDAERFRRGAEVRELLVGASLIDRVPLELAARAAGSRETRAGLALFRDLAADGLLVHDETTFDLDDAVLSANVREHATGLFLPASKLSHLVRALVWVLVAAHRPVATPAIY
jgi:hypothetical protein